jgi:hypothetical protein
MNTSEQLNEIAAALTKAQASMKNAALNKVNPHFKSKYADLAGIRDTVVPALTANGIAVVQTLAQGLVLTRLIHTSGQWIESACPIPTAPDMQKMGSAITYARRYSLSAICGISADEDDDGNAASQPTQAKPVAAVPAGFQDWLTDLGAVADEGEAALKAAWTKSKPEFRTYLTATNNGMWETMKARASKVKVSA